jgi:hypothetical protein
VGLFVWPLLTIRSFVDKVTSKVWQVSKNLSGLHNRCFVVLPSRLFAARLVFSYDVEDV